MQQIEKKEWYNKEDILVLYPLGVTTYKKRIKKLNTPQFSGYTRMITKPLVEHNLKNIQIREIHKSVLDDLFGDIRIPNQKNKDNVIKWVKNIKWDWFGDIVPCNSYPKELEGKMTLVFSQISKLHKGDKFTIFYSIEKNTEDDYYHAHFLIKNGLQELNKKKVNEILELVCEKNTATETRIYLKPYDYVNFGLDGSSYTLKDLRFGYGILR